MGKQYQTRYDWTEKITRELYYYSQNIRMWCTAMMDREIFSWRKVSRKPYIIYLVNVFGGREKHRRFIEVAHRIEFGPFARRMIKFVDLLASCSSHFSFCRSPLLIPGLSFSSLKTKIKINKNRYLRLL